MVRNNAESVGLFIKPFDDTNLIRPQATRPPAFLYQNKQFNNNNNNERLKSYSVVALSLIPVLPPSSMP